jgi:hypothetical protein
MDIERVNATLVKAIGQLQVEEVEGLTEAGDGFRRWKRGERLAVGTLVSGTKSRDEVWKVTSTKGEFGDHKLWGTAYRAVGVEGTRRSGNIYINKNGLLTWVSEHDEVEAEIYADNMAGRDGHALVKSS